ncbi:ABC transporter ATP-binding protein [Roseiflexus sp.]|uniref:ABC transporter ATP-binding protein n=1 Tax=Roseiflexus sp. TaxID=2562120 RepID=UPI0021DB8894|nr:ABC transporter ATP-binding protein [Roseiflexus sp.]GIW00189.1 MAG: polyamine-transporting ATPase [Roseiflexus sp.]
MAFLEIVGVRKSFGATVAVEHFDLTVERGEFVSFLGPSGCGKTTTLRMVAGFEKPTTGRIIIDSVDVTDMPPNRRNIGMVFQSYALFPNMTVAENIGFGLKIARRPADEIRARVEELLRIMHMPEVGRRYPYQLSGGQQQRVALARALAIHPKVLLLDEPLSALDAKIRASLRQEIREIQRQLGITTIYVTHDQEEAMALSDRIVVMSRGRVEQIGTPFEVYNFPATRFVASFVGTLNLIQATVVDAALGLLSIEGQPIRVARPLVQHRPGDAISLAIRPELIALDGQMNGEVNRLSGIVEDVTFLGSIVRVQVHLSANKLHFDLFNNPQLHPLQPGSSITVQFAPESCLVLGEDGSSHHSMSASATQAA